MRNYKIHVLFGESTTMMSWIFKLDPALIMTWGNYRSEQLTTGRGQINTVDLYHFHIIFNLNQFLPQLH